MALIPLSPSRLTPAAPSERGRLFASEKRGGNVQHSCGASTCAAPPQDKRTHARRKPSAQPNPSGTANPKAHRRPKPPQPHLVDQTHPRETKDLNYRSQPDKPACARLRPKQPASGSGEPRKRLKLRSAMHNYVSCLGMTTYKISANIRFHRT